MAKRANNIPNGRFEQNKINRIVHILIASFGIGAVIQFAIWAHEPGTVYALQINNNYQFPITVLIHNGYDLDSEPAMLGTVPAHAGVTYWHKLVKYTDHDLVFRDQQKRTVLRLSITGKEVDQAVIKNVYSISIGPQPMLAQHVKPSKASRATYGGNVNVRP